MADTKKNYLWGLGSEWVNDCPEVIIKLSCTYQWGKRSGKKDEKIDSPKPENIDHPSSNPGEN